VKLEFSAPYWSLDQAKAWALTRHPELVSWAAKPANFKGAPAALAARIGLYLQQARRQGQDVNAELWRTSGRPLPIESPSARNDDPESPSEHGPDEFQRQEQLDGDESALARLPLFPIEDHFVQLLRAGRIRSLGKRPSERRHQEISAADWMGLEIAELVGISVAKSEATCLFVMLSQPDVLREFPEFPIEPKSSGAEPPDLTTVLRNEIEAKGATLTQAEAEKFARKAGVTEGRKKIRATLKALGVSSTTGPKGPQKNRADA
jgi:hypothetical protein